jgi:lysyl-tRNA synthetase class 2
MVRDNRPQRAPAWRADRLAERRPRLAARARILAAMRTWFAAEDFIEVDTPVLQAAPGAEVHLKAFAADLESPEGERRRLWLHTSPEFAMKKLLAGGVERLFQFAHVFRNGERSALHHPEFTMLEWYRVRQSYETLMADCETLLRLAAQAAGARQLAWQGRTCDVALPFERLSVADAFARHAGIDLLATAPDPAQPDAALLSHAARHAGIAVHEGDGWDDVVFRVLFERIEPVLGFGRPTILCDYPASMAALSRRKPGDPRVAERFELYVCGVELANAFGELTDPVEQRARLEDDMAEKQRRYGERWPIDEDFIAALQSGLPPCSGIALGFDRLVMLCTGATTIEDVLWLPVS